MIILTSILLSVSPVETPEKDNSETLYCVAAPRKDSKTETKEVEKSSCKVGSVEVNKDKVTLVERNSK